MFKPFTTTLTTEEASQVFRALDIGLKALKRENSPYEQSNTAFVEKVIKMMNDHERIGGWDNKYDMRKDMIKSIVDECAVYGCD